MADKKEEKGDKEKEKPPSMDERAKKAGEVVAKLNKVVKIPPGVADDFEKQVKAVNEKLKTAKNALDAVGSALKNPKVQKMLKKLVSDKKQQKMLEAVESLAGAFGPLVEVSGAVLIFLSATGLVTMPETAEEATLRLLNEISSKLDDLRGDMKLGFDRVESAIGKLESKLPVAVSYNQHEADLKAYLKTFKINERTLLSDKKLADTDGSKLQLRRSLLDNTIPSSKLRDLVSALQKMQMLIMEGQGVPRQTYFEVLRQDMDSAEHGVPKMTRAIQLMTAFIESMTLQFECAQMLTLVLRVVYSHSKKPEDQAFYMSQTGPLLEIYQNISKQREAFDPADFQIGGDCYGNAKVADLFAPDGFGLIIPEKLSFIAGDVLTRELNNCALYLRGDVLTTCDPIPKKQNVFDFGWDGRLQEQQKNLEENLRKFGGFHLYPVMCDGKIRLAFQYMGENKHGCYGKFLGVSDDGIIKARSFEKKACLFVYDPGMMTLSPLKHPDRVWNVHGGLAGNHKVGLFERKGGDNEKLSFPVYPFFDEMKFYDLFTIAVGSSEIPDGHYCLLSACSFKIVTENFLDYGGKLGAPVKQSRGANALSALPDQCRWHIRHETKAGTRVAVLKNKQSGHYLNVAGAGTSNGTAIQVWENSSDLGNHWRVLIKSGSVVRVPPFTQVMLQSVKSGKYLNVPGGTFDDADLKLWDGDDNLHNLYYLVPLDSLE